MLRQASVGDLFSGRIQRKDGYIAVVMKHYPRGLRRELRDEYVRILSPPFLLFREFRRYKLSLVDHDEAFEACDYEDHFWIEEEGFDDLKRLAKLSRAQDVYLVCQCNVGERCHRELLMMLAQKLYGAETELFNSYPKFKKRLVSKRDAPLEASPL
jgi:uncharacterized protein YeaO (DUF488 family)